MRFLSLLIAVTCSVFSLCSQTTEELFIGHWDVVGVEVLVDVPPDQAQQLEMLKEAFLAASFTIEADHNFSFIFVFDEMSIQNAHWKVAKQEQGIIIQEWEYKNTDDHLLMGISRQEKDGKIFFFLPETFFLLEVERQ